MTNARDKWSYRTHLYGAILGAMGTIYLVISNLGNTPARIVTTTLFGVSMIALYSCSAIYHYSRGNEGKIKRLRKLDHAMIYVLIAGTYTPILFNGLPQPKATIFLVGIWVLAVIGIILKMFFLNVPRWLYTMLYILMGWAIVFDPKALTSLPQEVIFLLLAGGISYTVGAVFYILKRPNFTKEFGFHELFHCFILLGTILHFIAVAFYL